MPIAKRRACVADRFDPPPPRIAPAVTLV